MSTKSNIGRIALNVSMEVEGFHLSTGKTNEAKKYGRTEERKIDRFSFKCGFDVEEVTIEASKEAIEATFKGLKDSLNSLKDVKEETSKKSLKELNPVDYEAEFNHLCEIVKAPRGKYGHQRVQNARKRLVELINEEK